jgi:hypothetical protein
MQTDHPRFIVVVTRRLSRDERPPKSLRRSQVLEHGIVRSFSADGGTVTLTHPPKLWFEVAFHVEFLQAEAERLRKPIEIRVIEEPAGGEGAA